MPLEKPKWQRGRPESILKGKIQDKSPDQTSDGEYVRWVPESLDSKDKPQIKGTWVEVINYAGNVTQVKGSGD